MLRETRKLCFSRIALVGRRRSVRACQIYPSSCCFKDHWRVGGRRRRWRAGALVGGLLDVAKIKDLQSRASTCSKTLVAEGQMRCECCARFRHACIWDTVFNILAGRRPDQLHPPHLFFVPLLGRETIPEVKERRPQDGRCESPTAEECAPMCGWEVWLGMHRREGGAGAPLSFCPSGPALFGRAICWSRPKVSTVVLVVFLRWWKCFGGPNMSKWKLANKW